MSLVYNNDKPIGKCESYSIDKIHGTTPFVMLTNYEPLRSELSSNQQIVLEWLKEAYKRTKWSSPFGTVYSTINTHELFVRTRLTKAQQYQVLAAFAEWGIANAEE